MVFHIIKNFYLHDAKCVFLHGFYLRFVLNTCFTNFKGFMYRTKCSNMELLSPELVRGLRLNPASPFSSICRDILRSSDFLGALLEKEPDRYLRFTTNPFLLGDELGGGKTFRDCIALSCSIIA